MDLVVATLAERTDLIPLVNDFPAAWPEFMFHDVATAGVYDAVVLAHPEYCLVALDQLADARLVAKGFTLPFSWTGDPDSNLPSAGYDAVVTGAVLSRLTGQRGNLVSAVEVTIQRSARGSGISSVMLMAMRDNAARLGYTSLVAPVRPSRKHEHPDISMAEYVSWTREDGLPVDPWLRVHVRAGARIVGVAPRSMTVVGSLDDWRAWTGMSFDSDGLVQVPGALVPVRCDLDRDLAVYVEPNVWVHHPLTPG